MTRTNERELIYVAVALVCGTAGIFLGWMAGFWTFVQMAAVVEFVHLLGAES